MNDALAIGAAKGVYLSDAHERMIHVRNLGFRNYRSNMSVSCE